MEEIKDRFLKAKRDVEQPDKTACSEIVTLIF